MRFNKDPWRRENISWLKSHAGLWQKSKFRFAYAELLGETGDRSYELMRPHLRSPDQFYGLDHRTGWLMEHALKESPFQLVYGDAFASCLALMREEKTPIACLNFDGQDAIRTNWWSEHRDVLNEIVHEATALCDDLFVLILNHTLDRGADRYASIRDRLQTHAAGLARTFGPWHLSTQRILDGAEAAMTTPGYVGRAGGFRIYRSENESEATEEAAEEKGLHLRMVTVRLTFERGRKEVTLDRRPVDEIKTAEGIDSESHRQPSALL